MEWKNGLAYVLMCGLVACSGGSDNDVSDSDAADASDAATGDVSRPFDTADDDREPDALHADADTSEDTARDTQEDATDTNEVDEEVRPDAADTVSDVQDDGDETSQDADATDDSDTLDTADTADTADTVDDTADADATDPTDAVEDTDAADDAPDISDVDEPSRVAVDISMQVLLVNGYGNQLHPLYRPFFTSGSRLGRLALYAQFCTDSTCETVVDTVLVDVPGADAEGRYVYGTASPTGAGLAKAVSLLEAPVGTWFVRLVGDTEFGAPLADCSLGEACPGEADVLQTNVFVMEAADAERRRNPAPGGFSLTVPSAGFSTTLAQTMYLGHLVFGSTMPRTTFPETTERLLLATSDDTDTFRNTMKIVRLGAIQMPATAIDAASYVLQKSGEDFEGDVCAVIPAGDELVAVAIDNEGANFFFLDPQTGVQVSADPWLVIPPQDPRNATTWPWPCEGTYVEVGENRMLYLVQMVGAGSLDRSAPYPLYVVNLEDGSYHTPFGDALIDLAVRSLSYSPRTRRVFGVDMSWSVSSRINNPDRNRLVWISVGDDGLPNEVSSLVTEYGSQERCDSSLQWPSGVLVADVDGVDRLLVGHDLGVTMYDPENGLEIDNLELVGFGRLFAQVLRGPDGQFLAVPDCKAINANHNFRLPYAGGTEAADKNLIALIDVTSTRLSVSETDLDINGDGEADHGLDMDFYGLKAWLRGIDTTLPIPPVVYTGSRVVVSRDYAIVRGTGSQGNGETSVSSSGMGQAGDITFISRATGHGAMFRGTIPMFDGASARWGFPLRATDSSVRALYVLP